MYLKDIIDKKIVINCRTEEEVKKMFEYAKENGLEDCQSISEFIRRWKMFEENTCYRFYSINDNKEINYLWDNKDEYANIGYKIITLDDLEDFKDEKETIELFKDYILIKSAISFAFNKTKKKLYLKYFGKEIRVKCDEKDKFEWKIGLGLALYRVCQKDNDVKYMKKNYNYKKLAEYCLYKFYCFDENKIKDLEDRVNNSKENTLIRL